MTTPVTYEGIERVEILGHREHVLTGGICYHIRRADGSEEYRTGPLAGKGEPLSGSIVVRLRTFTLRSGGTLRIMETK